MSEAAPATQAPVQNTPPPPGSPEVKGSTGGGLENRPTIEASPSSPPEIYDVPVGGKIVRMTLQQMKDNASMVAMANQRFNEAAQIKRQSEERDRKYSENPLQAFLDHANQLSPEKRREAIEEYYMREYIEPESLTEEQRQSKAEKEELKKYKEREAAAQKQAEEDAYQKQTQGQREVFESEFIKTLEESKLPRDPETIKRMAALLVAAKKNGWNPTMQVIARQADEEITQYFRACADTYDVPQLIHRFGDGIVSKINRYFLEQLREKRNVRSVTNPPAPSEIDPSGKISYDEVNRRLRDMRSGKI